MTRVLDIEGLTLSFKSPLRHVEVLHGIDLYINAGEKVALVGESGSGKSVTARIVLGLLQELRSASIGGTIRFNGVALTSLSKKQHASLRGTDLSMIFQDPTSSLNPVFTIGHQFSEVLRRGSADLTQAQCDERAMQWLASVSISDAKRVLAAYPFQLSGGMNQRVMIAMALSNQPKLLLADEPGTALDVSVQAQTLTLMRKLVADYGTAVLFISHNLGVVREFADRVYVIYRGRIVEDGPANSIFANPRHAYTQALMAAVPRIVGSGLPDVPEVSEAFLAPRVSHGANP
jgi:ABC-type dipeptide/oligopeptide/nickel transport system ATPase component